jgi:hypothetical protein
MSWTSPALRHHHLRNASHRDNTVEPFTKVAEAFLKFVIQFAMDKCPEDFKILEEFEIRHLVKPLLAIICHVFAMFCPVWPCVFAGQVLGGLLDSPPGQS